MKFLPSKEFPGLLESSLANPDGSLGVRFSITNLPTCYRRGPYKLLVEVLSGKYHHQWGCFDEQDQPTRWFHKLENAKSEAKLIAKVLLSDFRKDVRS